jgi:hypothetical protein
MVSETLSNSINIGLVITYILIGAAIIGTVVFPLIQMVSDIKRAKSALIGIAAFLAVFLISYAISAPETGGIYEKFNISTTMSKIIGGGLIATYIVFAGAIIGIAASSISKWVK